MCLTSNNQWSSEQKETCENDNPSSSGMLNTGDVYTITILQMVYV